MKESNWTERKLTVRTRAERPWWTLY